MSILTLWRSFVLAKVACLHDALAERDELLREREEACALGAEQLEALLKEHAESGADLLRTRIVELNTQLEVANARVASTESQLAERTGTHAERTNCTPYFDNVYAHWHRVQCSSLARVNQASWSASQQHMPPRRQRPVPHGVKSKRARSR